MKRTIILITIFGICIMTEQSAAQQAPTREINHISGDLYQFRNNAHLAVFLVSPEGIIVTDPINKEAATWLKAELMRRFNQPVRYVVYSHDHADHISGGEVFDGAVVVAHETTKAAIIGEKRPTAVPHVVFNDRMAISLGGKTVHLIYAGLSHSDNSIIMHFPAERAVFVVDFISVKRMPYQSLNDSYFPDWIDAVRKVEAMDFDIFLPGHGMNGAKADVTEHRAYLEALYSAVLSAAREGRSLEEMKRIITLDQYKHFEQYGAWREMNIEGVYRQVSLHRVGN